MALFFFFLFFFTASLVVRGMAYMDCLRQALLKVFRVCGNNFASFTRSAQHVADDLPTNRLSNLGLLQTVESDEDGVRPQSICRICQRAVTRFRESRSSGRPYVQRGRP